MVSFYTSKISNTGIYKILLFFLINLIYSYEFYTTKGRSLGDGFVACCGDVESLVYNPAGIAFVEFPELFLDYQQLLPDVKKDLSLGRHIIGGVLPFRNKQELFLGATIMQFNSQIYKENLYQVVVSKNIKELIVKEKEKQKDIDVSVGIRLKYFEQSYPVNNLLQDDPLFSAGRQKGTISFDLGVFYITKRIYYFGLTLNDILEPNIGLKESSVLKRKLLLAFAYKHNISGKNISIIPNIGMRSYLNTTSFSSSIEVLYNVPRTKNIIFLRGTYSDWNVSMGIGYEFNNKIQFNYSYVFLNELDTVGGNYVSLIYRFPSSITVQKTEQNKEFENNLEIKKETPLSTSSKVGNLDDKNNLLEDKNSINDKLKKQTTSVKHK